MYIYIYICTQIPTGLLDDVSQNTWTSIPSPSRASRLPEELTSAYDTLMDPKRRAALDQATAGAYAGAGYNSYTGGFPNYQSHWTNMTFCVGLWTVELRTGELVCCFFC